ncbi:hypothetical protein QCA50_007508 [Cerrena zonata]|uniref:Transmembrane protein n=1 Tax=Cerrena zonata TaxID=2478898 RepID=A0AAW0GBW6_9APHY
MPPPETEGRNWPLNAVEASSRYTWDIAFRHLLKRGDSTTQASPSNDPAPQHDSNIPKIGGSSAGFIALVVALSSIVVLSCVGVFFLLRDHQQDPHERHERHARRVHSGKRETSIYDVPLGPPGMRARFKNWFGFGKKREGWVRANSGDDEWDASDLNPSYAPTFVKLSGAKKETQYTDNGSISTQYTSPPRPHVERSMTSDSIELSVPPLALDTTPISPPRDTYPNSFTFVSCFSQ